MNKDAIQGPAYASTNPSPTSRSPDNTRLLRRQLAVVGRPVADDAGPDAVQAAYAAWRTDADAADAVRRAEAERQRLEQAILGPLRERLIRAGTNPKGMDQSAMIACLTEMERADRQRRADRERIAADAARRSTADRMFAAAKFPTRHSDDIDVLTDATSPPKWIDYRNAIDARIATGRGLMAALLGPSGTGKTQVSTVIGYRASRRLTASRYVKAADLFRDVRRSYVQPGRGERGVSEAEILDGWAAVPLLVVDEFHQRSGSEAEFDIIVNLLDRRYDTHRATILIANQDRATFIKAIGQSVASRFSQMGKVFEFSWPSLRRPEDWA